MTDQLTPYIEKLITDKRSKSFITYSRRYIIDFLKYTEDKTLTKTLVKEWALSLNEKTNTPHEMRNIVYSVNGFLAFLNCSEFKLGKEKDFSFDDNGKLYLLLKPSDDLTGKRFNRLVVIKGVLDENGKPISIKPYERNEATKLIEDFMLAANETVAQHFYWQEIPFLYRVHDVPDAEKIQKQYGCVLRHSYERTYGY